MYYSALSVEELAKKWLETRDDKILDVLQRRDQDFKHGFITPRPLITEGYNAGSHSLHIHARFYGCGFEGKGYCVRASAIQVLGETDKMNGQIRASEDELSILAITSGEIHGAVLVSVAENIQDAQGICIRRPIASKAWLQGLDECLRVWGHSVQVPLPVFIPDLRPGVDWEFSMQAFTSGVLGPNQSADQIIQCGPHVEDGVTGQNTEPDGGNRVVGMVDNPSLFFLRIDLYPHMVLSALEKFNDFYMEDIQMFVSPDDFSVDALHARK
jgi:hypothetical protein